MTRAQATAFFGPTTKVVQGTNAGNGAICVWNVSPSGASDSAPSAASLRVHVYPGTQFYPGAGAITGAPLSGVGEKALIGSTADKGIGVEFVANGHTVVIAAANHGQSGAPGAVDVAAKRAALVALAKSVAGRI